MGLVLCGGESGAKTVNQSQSVAKRKDQIKCKITFDTQLKIVRLFYLRNHGHYKFLIILLPFHCLFFPETLGSIAGCVERLVNKKTFASNASSLQNSLIIHKSIDPSNGR